MVVASDVFSEETVAEVDPCNVGVEVVALVVVSVAFLEEMVVVFMESLEVELVFVDEEFVLSPFSRVLFSSRVSVLVMSWKQSVYGNICIHWAWASAIIRV